MTDTEIQINGMAHVILCVSDFGAARKFYERLLPALGMTPVCDTDKLFYCVGGRTAIGIQPADASERFVQGRVGLHHLCLRARSREDIDRLHDLLREMGSSFMRRRRGHGYRAITRCCSKTLMAFAWKRTLFRVLACLPLA